MKGEQIKPLSEILPPEKLEQLLNQCIHEFEVMREVANCHLEETKKLEKENEELRNHIETLNEIIGMYEQASETEEEAESRTLEDWLK